MKRLLPLLSIALFGCSTAELNTAKAIVDPVAIAFVAGLGQSYGIPATLTTPILTTLANDGWGMVIQSQAGNPIAQGAANPAVGAAVAATNPTTAQLVDAIGTLTLAKTNPKVGSALLAAIPPAVK